MQFVHEFLGLFGDAAAQHDEIGPQQRMQYSLITKFNSLAQASQLKPPSTLARPEARFSASRPATCRWPNSVFGTKPAIDEQRAADAGAQRQQQHGAGHIARSAVAQFRQDPRHPHR